MSGSDAKPGRSGGWEAHAQTVLIAITTAGILALVSQGWQMSQNQAAQAEALAEIKSKLERMENRFAEYPTRGEAETRWRGIESRLDEHGRRIERIEDKR
jgi:hypothetical protein